MKKVGEVREKQKGVERNLEEEYKRHKVIERKEGE